MIFENMQLWIDPVLRSGPEAMAVDEWLLEMAKTPILRVYAWQGAWASMGYFGQIKDAQIAFPHVSLVRRWTGGGMVDHRSDWTYSLIVPASEELARCRGAESYRRIHTALAEALRAERMEARMCGEGEETGATLCFENPVSHDLVDSGNRKLAGAGQRRSRMGLLHQGSVASRCRDEIASRNRAENLAGKLSEKWNEILLLPDFIDLTHRITTRYARLEWTNRR